MSKSKKNVVKKEVVAPAVVVEANETLQVEVSDVQEVTTEVENVVEIATGVKKVKTPKAEKPGVVVKLPEAQPIDPEQSYMFTEQRIIGYGNTYGMIIRNIVPEELPGLIVDIRQFILRGRSTDVIKKFIQLVQITPLEVSNKDAFQQAYLRIIEIERTAKKAARENLKGMVAQSVQSEIQSEVATEVQDAE
jgi:hypothetical protein